MAASTKTAAPTEAMGTTWLAEHVNSETGSEYNGYGIRILLRKLTKDGVIERGEGRYSFTGPRDKTVLAVVKAVKSGEADKAKSEKLDELKEKRAAKKAAASSEDAPKPARRSRAKKTAEVDEEEAPKPARRSRAKKVAEPVVEDEDLDIDEI